jgi:ribulose kinase
MSKYVAAIDQGTTSTRCMIFNHSGESVAIHQMEHEQIYPKPGWVEHDPMEIWARTQDVVKGAMERAGITAKDLAAVGITNQRETTVVWDKNTGKPYTMPSSGKTPATTKYRGRDGQRWRARSLPPPGRFALGHLLLRPQGEMAAR